MESKLNFIFKSTSLHGFKHMSLNKDTKLWKKCFARTFWTTFIALSVGFMIHILRTSLGSLNSTSINLDINYRDWINAFPGISICLNKGLATTPIKKYLQNVTSG